MRFYEKLVFVMDLARTSNRELAQALGVDPAVVSRLRNGRRGAPRKEETVRRLHPKKQVAGVLISLLVLAGLGWTCTRVDMGYICGCIALVAGVLKYRNIIQFNSLTVQRFRNTYKDEMDLNKYNKYVDSHF